MKFLPPFGWKKEMSRDREWAVFTAPGEDAVLAFSTFNQPGESTKRLAKGAATLGATNPDWRAPHWGSVGKDQFPAHVAEGECYFKGPNGFIWYATVNAGTADQILMMFTVSAAAPRSRRSEAQASIETLQRR